METTVLIVDDDQVLRSAIAHWAEAQNYHVLAAESAEQALKLLATQAADVALVDVRLPGMDGLALAAQLIADYPDRPVLLMTAFADLENARQALKAGVYEYFTKPFNFVDVGAGIQRALQHRRLLQEKQTHQLALEREVVRRTAELQQANLQLQQEIEERKKVEEALRESEKQLQLVTDTLPIFVAYVDAHQRYRFVNRQYEIAFSLPQSHFSGRHVREVVGEAIYAQFEPHIAEVLGGREVIFETPAPYARHRMVSITYMPHTGSDGFVQGFFSLMLDITDRKRLSEKIVQLERLGALAELSAGVSHNLNNILTGVLGPAQLIEMQTQDEGIIREARVIQEAAMRATDLIRRLGQAVGGEDDVPLPVDVVRSIREAVDSAKPRWKDEAEARGVTIDVMMDLQQVPAVRATYGGLYNALLNVIFNSVDAMPGGGTLALAAEAADSVVRITVSDTGIGMDEETRRRIFEPFFTTKAHVGTGLGMAMVFTAVSRWGGRIDISSTLGEGTSVMIELPVWQETRKAPQNTASAARAGSLLIVDDEFVVRAFLFRALSKHHRVDAVLDGAEALAHCAERSYDAALIDLGMPGMPGDQVARALRECDPHIATILITGWDLAPDDARFALFDYHLKKPFETIDKILSVVAQAIQRRDERFNAES